MYINFIWTLFAFLLFRVYQFIKLFNFFVDDESKFKYILFNSKRQSGNNVGT